MPDMPDTLALTMRQSLVATDSAGREKSLSTPAGSGPVGASGAAGSSAASGVVASNVVSTGVRVGVLIVVLSAPMADADPAPHSDSTTGTQQAGRRKKRNVIERLVELATADEVPRSGKCCAGNPASHVHRADGLAARATGEHRPVVGQCVESVRRGTKTAVSGTDVRGISNCRSNVRPDTEPSDDAGFRRAFEHGNDGAGGRRVQERDGGGRLGVR